MPTHRKHSSLDQFYFVTFTCYKWLPLLEKSAIYDYLPKWVKEINKRGILVCGYVFMPNHIHFLVYVKEQSKGLNHVIGEAKRFLAYEIVSRLKQKKEIEILEKLVAGVQKQELKKGKRHQVFRLSFDAKAMEGEEAIHGVLDYLPRRQGGYTS